ncbi:gliding motility lipoprotein GldH [Flavicella sp.]|uniref:gliding motility lipoprotein GldH n=1 Tax=Flavicella sp. TaxID=2957742 RepID=UPI00301AF530
MPIKTHKLILLFSLLISLSACDEHRVFDSYSSVGTVGWNKEDLVSFQFEMLDSIGSYDLFIQVRNTNEFEYSNLYLITELQYPSGFHVIDTLEYKMADSFGRWLGSGFTDIKENKLYYKENFEFSEKGTYGFNIQQAMRKRNELEGIQSLKGVSDVGFRIERRNK